MLYPFYDLSSRSGEMNFPKKQKHDAIPYTPKYVFDSHDAHLMTGFMYIKYCAGGEGEGACIERVY